MIERKSHERASIPQIAKLAKDKNDSLYRSRIEGWSKFVYLLGRHTRTVRCWGRGIVESAQMATKYGSVVKNKIGVGVVTQLRQQLVCNVQYGISPHNYYLYSIYDDFDRAGWYVSKDAWGGMLEALLAKQGGDEGGILDDKRVSERHYRQHNLSSIPILAEFESGEVIPVAWDGQSSLPACDLFSKPINARQGAGAVRWFAQPSGGFRTEEGEYIDQKELLRRLKAQSRKSVVLLQRRVFNHPRLQRLTGYSLATVRIVTMRSPGGDPEYLAGLIGLPTGDVIASNFVPHFDVIGASIDEETGQLGVAYKKDPAYVMEPIKDHPVTGHRIEGFRLPDWEEAVALAERAHDTLPNIALIGWDIGLTPDGPLIIEGNRTPGGESIQVAHKKPWGATRFPELYRANFEHVYGGSPKLK